MPDALRQRAAERHSAEDGSALAEERRLFYVAMTRARDELILSHAAQDGAGRPKRPSIFIAEALDRPAAMLPTDPGLLAPLDRLANLAPTPSPTTELRPGSADERLNLSFSQLDDYLTCPLKYKLRHVVGVPVPPHHALAYGTAMHHAVAAFHGAGRRGRIMTEEELLAVLNEHWASEGYLSRQHEEVRYAAARSALLRFRSGQLAEAVVPAAVEQEFSFSFGRDRIRGRFDRVDATPDGVVITDYKSSDVREQAKADQKARESLQLAIYGMAHEAETGTLPHEVQLHFLDSGVIGRARLDQRRLERARHKIGAAAEGIRARSFAAKPGYISCGYCPFRDICPEGSR
ncbi:MAG: ATP-dependent helicase [Chloroflexi bacterium]|nr:ATP-dependent helicase [Chloroflexota bacterium]